MSITEFLSFGMIQVETNETYRRQSYANLNMLQTNRQQRSNCQCIFGDISWLLISLSQIWTVIFSLSLSPFLSLSLSLALSLSLPLSLFLSLSLFIHIYIHITYPVAESWPRYGSSPYTAGRERSCSWLSLWLMPWTDGDPWSCQTETKPGLIQ